MRCVSLALASATFLSLVAGVALVNEVSPARQSRNVLASTPRSAGLLLRGSAVSNQSVDISNGAAAAVANEEDPSPEVREAFVRKCRVTMNVGDNDLLPVEPLQKFCAMTEAVVECRSKLVERLKEDHANGRSLANFCGAVYDWFQGKYGMFCPAQCKKLQCRPTCAWLKRQKSLKKVKKLLKADMQDSAASRETLDQLGSAVKEAKAALTRQNRSVDQAEVSLSRALRNQQEAEAEFATEKEKDERLKNESLVLQEEVRRGAEKISQGNVELRQIQWAIDKAEVNRSRMVRELENLEVKIGQKSKRNGQQEEELIAQEEDKKVIEAAAEKERQAVNKTVAAVNAQRAVVQKRSDAMQRARDKLEAAKSAGNHSAETIKGYEGLVKDQDARYKKAYDNLTELEESERKRRQKTRHAEEAIERIDQDLRDLLSKANAAKSEIEELNATFQRLQNEADTFAEKEIKLRRDRADTLRNSIDNMMKDQGKAEKTLEFSRKAVKEQEQQLSRSEAKVSTMNQATKEAEDALASSQEVLGIRSKELEKLIVQENNRTSEFEAEYGELQRRLEDHKNATETLRKDTPEIVHQHGLGLFIELMGATGM